MYVSVDMSVGLDFTFDQFCLRDKCVVFAQSVND